jgi:hypothetical protein
VLVFVAARSLARAPVWARRVLHALLIGAVLSGLTALIESAFPRTGAAFDLFRQSSFGSFGLPRASGVFGYPTIGAVYWEAAVPLVIVLPIVHERPSARGAVVSCGLAAVLFAAILASATRSAIAGSAVLCVASWLLTRRWSRGLARASLASLTALVLVSAASAVLPGTASLLGQRLRFWNDAAWFGVKYEVPAAPRLVRDGELFRTHVRLVNTGAITWRRTGDRPTHLAHHWYAETEGAETMVAFNGRRTELPQDVPPGGTVEVDGVARAPLVAGPYRLAWDLVQEGVTWFSERGNATADEPIVVDGEAAAAGPPEPDVQWSAPLPPPPVRTALWRAAVQLWRAHPILGIGADNFRRRYQAVLTPGPGGEAYTDTRIHANSLYFETLADEGLLGVAALVTLAVAWLRVLRAHAASKHALGLAAALAAGAFFVHGTFDYFLEFTPTYGLFWLLLGLTAAAAARGEPSTV